MMRRFKTFLNNVPPVSLEGLYDLTVELLALGRTNVVRLLLEHEPKVARYSQASGLRPSFLHFCIPRFCISDVMIELVLDAYPEASSKMDRKGFLPLHLALMSLRSSSETYIRTTVAIAIYPGAARVSHEELYGLFPLHFCLELVSMNASENFTLAMIEAYPEAASIKASYTNATHGPSFTWRA